MPLPFLHHDDPDIINVTTQDSVVVRGQGHVKGLLKPQGGQVELYPLFVPLADE